MTQIALHGEKVLRLLYRRGCDSPSENTEATRAIILVGAVLFSAAWIWRSLICIIRTPVAQSLQPMHVVGLISICPSGKRDKPVAAGQAFGVAAVHADRRDKHALHRTVGRLTGRSMCIRVGRMRLSVHLVTRERTIAAADTLRHVHDKDVDAVDNTCLDRDSPLLVRLSSGCGPCSSQRRSGRKETH